MFFPCPPAFVGPASNCLLLRNFPFRVPRLFTADHVVRAADVFTQEDERLCELFQHFAHVNFSFYKNPDEGESFLSF